MTGSGIGPTALLGGYLRQIGPDEAVKLARELCAQLEGDPDSFHGGVWPGNVDLDLEGKAVLGGPDHTPAAQRIADEVEYTAPEFFWNGSTSAAADVYAVGLMLYAGCNGGYLPFQPTQGELTDRDRADALRRRMKGQAVTAPAGVSGELKKVIEKALSYEPEERYITATEMLSALGRTDEALPAAAAAGGAILGAGEARPAVPEAEQPAPVAEPAASEAEQPAPEAESAAPAAEQPASVAEPAAPEAEQPASVAEPATETEPAVPVAEQPAPEAEQPTTAVKQPATGRPAKAEKSRPASGREQTAGGRQTHVRKDLEQTPRSRRSASAVPAAQRKKRPNRAAPILAALLGLAILGGAGGIFYTLQRDKPELSAPFSPPAPTEDASALPTVTPGASESPEPTATARPTASPRPSATPHPSASPQPTPGGGASVAGGMTGSAGTGSGASTNTGSSATGSAGYGAGSSGGYGTGSTGGYGTGSSGGYGTGSTGGTGSSGSGNTGGGNSAPTYTVQAANGTVYLTGDQVRVRSGPGTGYGIIGVTRRGDSLARTGTVSSGWTQVQYNGVTGYVSSQYLTDTAPATPVPSATAEPADSPAPSATPEPADTPAPSASPAPVYSVAKDAKTYDEAKAAAGTDGLAVVASQQQYDALVQALADAGLEYAWLGVEKTDEGVWQWADGTALDETYFHWAQDDPRTGAWLLLHKNGEDWQFITVDTVDPAAEPYAGKLGYAVNAPAGT